MVSYKDLGLDKTNGMFKKAMLSKYSVPAYNFNYMDRLQAIIQACVETKSPVIMQVSSGARKYANSTLLRNMAKGTVEYGKSGYDPDYYLIDTEALCKDSVDSIPRTDVNSLAISISTSHGAKKFKPEQCTRSVCKINIDSDGKFAMTATVRTVFVEKPAESDPRKFLCPARDAFKELRNNKTIIFDNFAEKVQKLPGFPIVLRGSSSAPKGMVKMINPNAYILKDAVGIPEDQLRKAVKSTVRKINIINYAYQYDATYKKNWVFLRRKAMYDLIKIAIEFIKKYLGVTSMIVFFLLCCLVFAWHQHLNLKDQDTHIKKLEKYNERDIKIRDKEIEFLKKKLEMTEKFPTKPP